ncbi:MAG: pyrimidine dimer DNA glycosylase/endonuclease V [Nitrososphaeria archaeon]
MRLWSLHPRLLDRMGLLALWREGLLAQKVLLGETRGYRNHPQLIRFRLTSDPLTYIGTYLYHVYLEGARRGYALNPGKILRYDLSVERLKVTSGQLQFEWEHLLEKLKRRDPEWYRKLLGARPEPHPLFTAVEGDVEPWERGTKASRELPDPRLPRRRS